uniref:Uncharacterized protein n=1 Tax=Octopus bimaculoides TaxID=37653 RepID=A0A0L8HD36_OCTBM
MMSHTHAHCAARTIDTNLISVRRFCSWWVSGKENKLLEKKKNEEEKKNVENIKKENSIDKKEKEKLTGHKILTLCKSQS